MGRFIVATRNKGKIKEIEEILDGFPFKVISMEDAGICRDIDEHGGSFKENALIKAEEVFGITGEMVMADDSGLETDYLNGGPGIYSSRFAGMDATDEDRNNKLLELLKGVPFEKRRARFVCAIAVITPENGCFTVEGTCDGYIAFAPEGENGFGYDPIFYVPQYNMTTAQMRPEQKHMISHRGKALRLMRSELAKAINN